jgi:hypothetical protein
MKAVTIGRHNLNYRFPATRTRHVPLRESRRTTARQAASLVCSTCICQYLAWRSQNY